MIPSHDPRVNLKVLEAAVDQFAAYLRSGSIAHPIVVTVEGHTYRPSISIGFVRELVRELAQRAPDLDADGRARLAALAQELEAVGSTHAADYAGHLQRELKSHLDTWRYFLDDCARASEECAENYQAEVRARTRIAHLLAEAAAHGVDSAGARTRLAELDRVLDRLVEPGPFAGPAGQAERYPEGEYPWLYRRPRRPSLSVA